MKLSFRNVAIVSSTAVLSAIGASKCNRLLSRAPEMTKEFVRVQNPNRYRQIMESGQENNTKLWNDAVQEIGDTLEKLNNDAKSGHFRLNPLLEDTFQNSSLNIK